MYFIDPVVHIAVLNLTETGRYLISKHSRESAKLFMIFLGVFINISSFVATVFVYILSSRLNLYFKTSAIESVKTFPNLICYLNYFMM